MNTFTSRELKGFNFENLIGKSVNEYGFLHNDFRGSGSDFRHERYPIELEAKFSHAIIYPSWVKRDWISRFSNNAKFKVVVSNRGIKLSDRCLKLLKVNRIIHVYFDQLRETIELLIALCSSEGVTSSRTSKGCKFKCYSVRNVKDYNLSGFYNVDLAEDYSKFLFSQDVKSKLSKDTMKLLRKIHENNLPIEIIFINNQKEMDEFVESLKDGKDKAEDPNKYDENVNYQKLLNKELREHKRRTRQEREYEKFSVQLSKSIEKDGVIEQPVICQYGVISGLDRIRHMKGLPMFVDELFTKETADKFGFKWIDVKDKNEYYRKRVTCAYLRKPDSLREDLLLWAESLAGAMPTNEVCSYISKELEGILSPRTIERYLPNEYKRKYEMKSNSDMLSQLTTKPDTVTMSIRLPRPLYEGYKEKYKGQVNFRLKWLIEKDLRHDLVFKEDIESFLQANKPEQQPEIKELIENSKELVQRHPVEVEHKVKEDYCGVCGKFTRFEWDSFNQQYVCIECKNRELNRVKQTPAKVEIRQVVK